MARITNTRVRVREMADRVAAEGGKPTPTLIRELLGGGSPNTIVSELKAWSAERAQATPTTSPSGAQVQTAKAVEKLGFEALASLLNEVAQTNQRLAEDVNSVLDATRQALQDFDAIRTLSATCEALTRQLETDRAWMQDELSKLGERFDGVQKHMLMSIESSRSEVVYWKDLARQAREELNAWRSPLQARNAQLEEETALLRGKLEGLLAGMGRTE